MPMDPYFASSWKPIGKRLSPDQQEVRQALHDLPFNWEKDPYQELIKRRISGERLCDGEMAYMQDRQKKRYFRRGRIWHKAVKEIGPNRGNIVGGFGTHGL